MSRGIIILLAVIVIVLVALFALASVDTRVAPAEVQKDMLTNAAPAQ